MARSNVGNGGSYFDLVFQLVSDDGITQVVRAVVYLTSPRVVDSVNNFTVGGNYSRSGAISLNGIYSGSPIWYQDVAFTRQVGANYNISVSASISGVEYWGTTLSASEIYTVPARYERPSPPGTSVDNINPTSARIVVSAPSYNGGANINAYEAYVLSNNALPGAGGNVVASASGGTFTANNLTPGTRYYYTARARNAAGLWSSWAAMKVFDTLPAAMVKQNGVWRNALVYVKVNGTWRLATPYVKVNGVWRLA